MQDNMPTYIQQMQDIKKKEMISNEELCKWVGISYLTFLRALQFQGEHLSYITKRKIRDFVLKYQSRQKETHETI